MSVSPNTQAILLLTAHFAKSRKDAVKPLTPKEWGRFALWLKEKSLMPEQLMNGRPRELLNGWSDKTITLARIEGLMDRGSALGLAMEKWLRAGLWVMTRSDPDYPTRLKKRLRTDSPAVLFGCGNRTLLNTGGLAVVGSRNATEQDLAYSRNLGALAAGSGYSIVSGGARGVDEAAMLGALEADGTVIGVLADNLLRACSTARYRKYLMANNLVLISTFYPEVGFNAGNAMQRNKYIYCLSDAALVVHSGEKGGTWNGALENVKKQWVPLWVKRTSDPKAGNAAIVKAGALWVPESVREIDFNSLFSVAPAVAAAGEDLFSQTANKVNEDSTDYANEQPEESVSAPETAIENGSAHDVNTGTADADVRQPEQRKASSRPADDLEFYDLFLMKAEILCSDAPKTTDELVEILGLNKTQLNAWLKRAVSEEKLKKLTRPVRYQWITTLQSNLPL
ncbi:MAG: DNA-protecting protein DprA [gamma proteobacterium symbiont of Bathyaustriella thionipta]|nr:DNA-protecting protein DprA [gamma proteobacterium symbiont of Bathyaustriella thionipta]